MEIQQSLGGLEMIPHNGRVYPQSSFGAADRVRQAGIFGATGAGTVGLPHRGLILTT